MEQDRISGLALIAGSLAAVMTMALHPIGGHLRSDMDHLARMATMGRWIHILGIASICIQAFGFSGFAQRLGLRRARVRAGLVAFVLGWIAVIGAATASGLIGPALIDRYPGTLDAEKPALHAIWDFNREVNLALAGIFVVATCIGILLWSLVLVRKAAPWRWTGVAGVGMSATGLALMGAGFLEFDVRGFGLLVFVYSAWTTLVGALLCRRAPRSA